MAFEMARRLRESGDEVALVGLFDTMMNPLRWRLRSFFSSIRRRMAQFTASAIAAPIESWPSAVWKVGSRACERLRGVVKSAPSNVLKVAASALIASARYRPGFYPGQLTLFTPMDREPGLPSLRAIWRTHARTLSIVETAGAHSTMFSATNAVSVAASLTRCLPVCAERTSRPVVTFRHVAATQRGYDSFVSPGALKHE